MKINALNSLFAFAIIVGSGAVGAQSFPIDKEFQGKWAESYSKCDSNTFLEIRKTSIKLHDNGDVQQISKYDVSRSCYGKGDPEGNIICVLPYEGELDSIDIDRRNWSATPKKFRRGDDNQEGFSLENTKLVRCE